MLVLTRIWNRPTWCRWPPPHPIPPLINISFIQVHWIHKCDYLCHPNNEAFAKPCRYFCSVYRNSPMELKCMQRPVMYVYNALFTLPWIHLYGYWYWQIIMFSSGLEGRQFSLCCYFNGWMESKINFPRIYLLTIWALRDIRTDAATQIWHCLHFFESSGGRWKYSSIGL